MASTELPINDIATFVAVAQNASFTKAAEKLGTSKSNVGKAVQRLEVRLGTRLLQRTTRAVRLTEDGELYLDAARAALDGLNEAEITLSARRDEPVGRVRLDIPIGFGRMLLPVFVQVRERHPKVTIELSLSDRQSDPVKDGWDIVVRAGELPAEGDMTARKLCDIRLGLYASSDYLGRHAPLISVDNLTGHEAIIFRAGSGKTRPWTVTNGKCVFNTAPPASVITGDGRAFIDSAIAGMGIAQIFDRVAAMHVESGELEHVLPQADVNGPPVHALIPAGRRMPPKTRVVLDQLVEFFKRPL
ncbi:LysR family transcriptional regulator [Bradyrhizobium sp. 31Argb]|uniref:LysR family transcriptional regulator n=1 Tax=unclassified Bradyrhizobium TaxID=2631580 RepID=UPI00102E628D|nr:MULTISPECIES: LysR family transcriptional regulator [unclassified Bradyrhizobium]MDI4231787.1 LysR family transcriptional regulator [Bradyrhizobium sp. Arg237L]TAI65663.1 LysR family transcriptional regulator [Bradyrhizobium sp. Leo170]